MTVMFGELTAPELNQLAEEDAVVLIPCGTIEQHGPHLPVQTDTLLAGEVSRLAAEIASETHPVLVTPTVWMGFSFHHMPLGGTISASYDTMRAILFDICESLLEHGFRRLMIVNGHGGNIGPLGVIMRELTLHFDTPIAFTTYSRSADENTAAILDVQRGNYHAGESETSMVMHLAPDQVREDRLEKGGPSGERLGKYVKGVSTFRTLKPRSPNGVMGDARPATAEKGEKLVEYFAQRLAQRALTMEIWELPIR